MITIDLRTFNEQILTSKKKKKIQRYNFRRKETIDSRNNRILDIIANNTIGYDRGSERTGG